MKRLFERFWQTFCSKKFLGFCLIGFINTFNTAFFSWLAHFVIQKNIAAYIGYILSLTVNYLLNGKLVFRDTLSFRKYLRFCVSYIPNFIIYFLVSFITINLLRMPQFWATVIATAVGGPITFVIIKLYAFDERKPRSENTL